MANFYSGLASGLQQGAEQKDRDRRYALDLDERLNRASQQELENTRANERMQMARDSAMRQNRMADLQYGELQDKAQRERAYREEMSGYMKGYWEPEEIKDAQGNVVGTKRRDWKDLNEQQNFLEGIFKIDAKYNPKNAEQVAQYFQTKQALAESGNEQLWRDLLSNKPEATKRIGSMFGATSLTPELKADGNQLSFVFRGKDAAGKDVVVDGYQVMTALGAKTDPSAGIRANAQANSRMQYEDRVGRGALLRGQNSGGGRDGDSIDRMVLSEKSRAFDDLKRGFPISGEYGVAMEGATDDSKTYFVRELANDLISHAAASGKVLPASDAISMALKEYRQLEQAAITQLRATPEWTKSKMAKDRIALRDRVVDSMWAERTKPREKPADKQVQPARDKALKKD